MKIRLLALAALLLAFAAAAGARPGPPPPPPGGFGLGKFWKRPEVRRQLRLSDAQVKSLEAVFLRHQRALVDLKAEVDRRQIDLDELLADDRADERQLSAAVEVLEDARGKLGKSRAFMMLEVRRILTPVQRKAMQEMKDDRREDRRGARRGRPGGPPERPEPGGFDAPPPEGPPPDDPD